MASPITVLLADDQQLLLLMYRQVLQEYGVKVVAECKTPSSAIEKYKELKPNVVLLDIRFGVEATGFDVIKAIIEHDRNAKIIIISQFNLAPYIKKAYSLGAKSFLTKDCDRETLFNAVRDVSMGEEFHMSSVLETVKEMTEHSDAHPKIVLDSESFDIFMLIAEGKTNQEIASYNNVVMDRVIYCREKIQNILKIDRPQQYCKLAIRHGLMVP